MISGGWVTALLAFLGAAVGAAGAYLAAARGLRQRERQARMEEWGRRFSAALDDVAADTFRRRELGRVVLVQLAGSRLADEEERVLARAVLQAGARLDDEGEDVTHTAPGVTVDLLDFVEDTEDEQEGGRG
jgi:hypothetical protein